MSATPILDRLAPVPPRVSPRSEMTVVFVVWSCILAALAASVLLGRPPAARRWLLHELPQWVEAQGPGRSIALLALTVLLSSLAMVAVHEGGHVLGGLAMGFRFKSIRVGPLQLDRAFRLSLQGGLLTAISGVAVVVPMTTERLVPRARVMVLAGPAANILSGCLVLLLPFSMGFPSVLFVVQSIANGFSDLLPYRNKLGVSDGKFLWALFRHPARAERWLASMRLSTATMEGLLPESLPADFLSKAIAVRDDSLDTVVAHAFAYASAFHRHRDEEAGAMLETCLRYSGRAPVALREALMADAAVFQAIRRRRVDLAEQWRAEIPEGTQIAFLRPKVEAAILQARGDVEGAASKLEDYESAVNALPAAWQREYHRRLLGRWKSEMVSSATRGLP